MSDLPERLRSLAPDMHGPYKDAMFAAADRIEELEAILGRACRLADTYAAQLRQVKDGTP